MSNLRQLQVSFTSYLVANNGVSFSTSYTSNGYWIQQLTPYNNKLTYAVKNSTISAGSAQDMICPSATSLAMDVGSASTAWGTPVTSGKVYKAAYTAGNSIDPSTTYPATTNTFWSFLNNNYTDANNNSFVYAGSYGFNGWLYNSNIPTGNAMAGSISSNGNCSINGSTVTVNNTNVKTINGNATAGGTISGSISGTEKQNVAGLQLPPVLKIYNQLVSTAYTVNSVSTLDFTKHSVLFYNGSADLGSSTVLGAGTLCVGGSVTGLPLSGQKISLVVNGSVTTNGSKGSNFSGALYMTGDLTTNGGNAVINGVVVVDGAITLHGNGTLNCSGGSLPSWGGYGYVPNVMGTTNIMTFADAIWPEGTPSLGDAIPTNTNTGDVTSQMGRFYIARHGSTINAAFTDGHVENASLSKLTTWDWNH